MPLRAPLHAGMPASITVTSSAPPSASVTAVSNRAPPAPKTTTLAWSGSLLTHWDFGLEVVVPEAADRATVHQVIYDELCQGLIRDTSRDAYRDIIAKHQDQMDCVILGCTEITMLISADDCPYAMFDTTALHAQAAVDFALNSNNSAS